MVRINQITRQPGDYGCTCSHRAWGGTDGQLELQSRGDAYYLRIDGSGAGTGSSRAAVVADIAVGEVIES